MVLFFMMLLFENMDLFPIFLSFFFSGLGLQKFLRFIENGFVVLPPIARAIHPVTEGYFSSS